MQIYEDIIKLQPKGVITLPKKLRDKLGLKDNSLIKIKEEKGKIFLQSVRTLDYPVRSYSNKEIKEFIELDKKSSV